MTKTITTVAATVGTSLRGNLQGLRAPGSFEGWLARQPESDRHFLSECRNDLVRASAAAAASRWIDVGQALARIPGTPRVLGAELSSLLSLGEEGRYANLRNFRLIHSDSPEGKGCAEAIQAYLQVKKSNVWCQLDRVPDLFHGDERQFRIKGLRGLATVLAKILREAGPHSLVIDATGGYKAQIAVAVVFGQAFKAPVVYLFEAFRHVIEMPVLPLTLDLSLVGEHLDLLVEDTISEDSLRDRFQGKPLTEANQSFAAFRAFLDEPVPIEGIDHFPVSAFGQIMLDRWRMEGGGDPDLVAASAQPKPEWGDHHLPSGIEKWTERLIRDHSWISRVAPMNAKGRTHVNGVFFRLMDDRESGSVPDILCRYVIDNNPALLRIKTTALSRRMQEAALRKLEREFRAS